MKILEFLCFKINNSNNPSIHLNFWIKKIIFCPSVKLPMIMMVLPAVARFMRQVNFLHVFSNNLR